MVSIWTMLTRSNSVALLPGVLSLLALGCGSSGARAVDGSSDGRSSTSDGAPDSIGRNPDASSKAVATCTTLVWVFGGCTAAVVDECEREYATFPASMATDVDAYAACLLTMVSGVPGGSATGSDAGCPTSSDSLNRWYFHGGCEGNAAQVNMDLGAFDPCGGTAVSCTTLTSEPDCSSRYGACNWTAGACTGDNPTPTPCATVAGACATVPGCTGTGFPECGGSGQPGCFFSQVLPGSTAL